MYLLLCEIPLAREQGAPPVTPYSLQHHCSRVPSEDRTGMALVCFCTSQELLFI